MAGLANYGDLKETVLRWLDRDDATTTAEVPNFILYAQVEIAKALRLPITRAIATVSLAAERVTMPTGFVAVRALTINDTHGLELTATSPGLRATHAATRPAGRPVEYSIEYGALALAPIPDAAYAATLIYDKSAQAMTADTDASPLFLEHPYVYLFGALAAGFAFNQFNEQAALYERQFRDALATIKRQGLKDAMSGPLQVRPWSGCTP